MKALVTLLAITLLACGPKAAPSEPPQPHGRVPGFGTSPNQREQMRSPDSDGAETKSETPTQAAEPDAGVP